MVRTAGPSRTGGPNPIRDPSLQQEEYCIQGTPDFESQSNMEVRDPINFIFFFQDLNSRGMEFVDIAVQTSCSDQDDHYVDNSNFLEIRIIDLMIILALGTSQLVFNVPCVRNPVASN